jgi:hypothetical protein
MATWLHQLTQRRWSPSKYRLDIWEGECTDWDDIGEVTGSPSHPEPQPGDTVLLVYAPYKCESPGFYGWAVVLKWTASPTKKKKRLYFRPVAPSDQLKMRPWGNAQAMNLFNKVRGKPGRDTLYFVDDKLARKIASGIASWMS